MAENGDEGNALLVHKHVFGLKVAVTNHLQYLNENHAMFPCGHNTVIMNTETRQQTLIHGAHPSVEKEVSDVGVKSEPFEGVTALALSPNRRTIGIAERGAVGLYDSKTFRRRRVLQYNGDLGSREIRSVSFSGDSKQVLTLGGAPDWTLVMWTTDRTAKVIATLKFGSAPFPGTAASPANASPGASFLADLGGRSPAAGSSSVAIRQADFHPTDSSIVCVTGKGLLKFLKVSDGTFKPLPMVLKREPQNYSAHCWLPDEQFVVATEQGEVLLLDNYEFRQVLSTPDGGGAVHSLKPFSKGFLCGGTVLRIFERTDDAREMFKCNKVYSTNEVALFPSPLVSMSIAPSEDTMICATLDHQMYSFALGTTEIVKSDDPGASFFELLTGTVTHGPGIQGADTAAIVGMDVCVWKPLLATCGRDHTVRIWNTIERTVEVTKRFSEEPLSVALHPSGLFLLVGFTDRVRLLSLLMDDMRTVKELNVKQCRTLSFSKGGHLFAMANQSAVQVLDTHTCAMVLQLRGHQQVVRSIMWTDRDRKISTIGKDGNVFLWDVRSGARVHESMQPRTSFTAACLAGHDYANSGGLTSSSRLFTLASDLTIRSFIATTLTPENQVQSDMEINCMLAAPNGRALFVGTAVPGQPGLLVSYIMKDARFPGTTSAQANAAANALALSGSDSGPGDARRAAASSTDKQQAAPPAVAGAFPPAPSVSTVESQVVVAHSSPMTSMCLSTDGSTLYTGGEDGSLCIFDVREVDARGVVKLQAAATAKLAAEQGGKGESGVGGGGGGHKTEQYASEILVTKEELVTKKKLSDELQGKVEELKLSSEHQLQLKDMQHQERVKDVTDKFTAELQECERNFEGLKSSKDALETSYVARLEALHANNEAELNMRQEQYRVKIETERLRKDALFEERKRQTAEWSASNTRTVSEQKNEVGKLTSDYEKKLEVEQLAQSNLHGEKEQVEAAWDVTRVRIEQDGDLEVEEIKLKYEARLKLEQEITMKLKKEHAEMKKRYQVLVKEVKEQDDAIKGLNVLEKQLRDVLKGLEKDIVGHKKEIREREETIGEKEKRIYDLKKKNQELEKFKFVLDYKIKELKRKIEPRENEIADMRTQVEEMDLELEQYHKSNSALDLMIGELRLKIDGMEREMDRQQGALHTAQGYLGKFRRELDAACSPHMYGDETQNPSRSYKALKHGLRGIFAKFVQEQRVNESSELAAMDPQMEYNREREHLERNVEALKKKIAKDIGTFMGDHARLTREGVNLTEEMNLLRREAKLLRRQHKSMDIETQSILRGGQHTESDGYVPSRKNATSMQLSSDETQRELEIQEGQLMALENRARELKLLLGFGGAD